MKYAYKDTGNEMNATLSDSVCPLCAVRKLNAEINSLKTFEVALL